MKELIMNAITWRRDSREGRIDESNVILTTQASQVNDTQVQTKTSVHGQPRKFSKQSIVPTRRRRYPGTPPLNVRPRGARVRVWRVYFVLSPIWIHTMKRVKGTDHRFGCSLPLWLVSLLTRKPSPCVSFHTFATRVYFHAYD